MKILIVASNMVHIKNFHLPYIEEFKKQGHNVSVLASGEGADFDIPFKKKALCLKNLSLVPKIKKILKRESFDAIYLHTTLAAFYVRLALKGMKKRPYVINTVHGYLFSSNEKGLIKRVYLWCEKFLKNQTDDIVVMNEEDLKIATESALCKNKIYKINGMGTTLHGSFLPKETSSTQRLTFVGEISKRKNQELLVRALPYLPNATLILVGDGGERKSVEALARKLGVENRLEITGFTKNVASYLEKTDIYVSASKIEGLPFNIIEAMSYGLPIVASDVKGHVDLLPSESLFESNCVDSLVNAIGKAAHYEYDVQKYTLNSVLPYNMEIYLSALNKGV